MKLKQLTALLVVVILLLLSMSLTQAQNAATTITFNGDAITIDGTGAAVTGSTVMITAGGAYSLSGKLNDGQVLVDSEDAAPVTLILNGVDLRSTTSAPIYIKEAEAIVITLAEDTQNYLSDGAAYVYASPDEDEPNAALFSDDALTIEGSGSLTVEANYNDGIASKDTLTIASGTITVNAVDDGIRGKDALTVTGGDLMVTAQGDGLKADNDEDTTLGYVAIDGGSFNITTGGDAITAETNVTITAGEFTLFSGGGSSASIAEDLSSKGIKAGVSLMIEGGTFTIDAADDALHTNGSLVINNGTFILATGDDGIHADTALTINGGDIDITTSYEGIESASITITAGDIHLVASDDGLNAAGGTDGATTGGRPGRGQNSGNFFLYIYGGSIVIDAAGDGVDANGSIEMTSGVVIVNGPTMSMNAALDYDGSFSITGGLFIATGSSGMAQTPDASSSQYALLLNLTSVQPAGTLVHIQTAAGEDILTFAPTKEYQSIAFSSPELGAGTAYQVYFGGSIDGTAVNGLYETGSYTPGIVGAEFTISSIVTQVGTQSRRR